MKGAIKAPFSLCKNDTDKASIGTRHSCIYISSNISAGK